MHRRLTYARLFEEIKKEKQPMQVNIRALPKDSPTIAVPPSHYGLDYDAQVIIDFLYKNSNFCSLASTPARKWNSTHIEKCTMLQGKEVLANRCHLNFVKKPNFIRIYIVGHCWIAADFIEGYNDDKVHFDKLATALQYLIKDQNVVINLISCCAGVGSQPNHDDSFAAKLHMALYMLTKKDIPVVARTSLSSSFPTEMRKATFSLAELAKHGDEILKRPEIYLTGQGQGFYLNKQPESKVIFMLDKMHKQIRVDSYEEKSKAKLIKEAEKKDELKKSAEEKLRIDEEQKWRIETYAAIDKVKINTYVISKKVLLITWLNAFKQGKTNKEIYLMLKQEYIKPLKLSILDRCGTSYTKIGFDSSDAIFNLLNFIEKGQELFSKPPISYTGLRREHGEANTP